MVGFKQEKRIEGWENEYESSEPCISKLRVRRRVSDGRPNGQCSQRKNGLFRPAGFSRLNGKPAN